MPDQHNVESVRNVQLTAWFEVLYKDITFDSKLLDKPSHHATGAFPGAKGDLLPPVVFAEVDGDTLLVAGDAPPPWTDTVHVEFPPDAQRIAYIRRLDFDDFRAKLPAYGHRPLEQSKSRCDLPEKLPTERPRDDLTEL